MRLTMTRVAALAVAAVALMAERAWATWSIVLVDTRTGELALAAATCRENRDLEFRTPVLLVGRGVAAAQSEVDVTGLTRQTILGGLAAGDAPEDILFALSAVDTAHEIRQYGLIDVQGRALSFTGSQTPAWSGGVVGRIEQGAPGPADDLVYAIQGNVLAGEPVVLAAESAVRGAAGDLADRLLAGMIAARVTGGDGRCSCTGANPTGCGAPPNENPELFKSAHIGFLMVSRAGDTDGPASVETGFATGDYWLHENVAFKDWSDPDPVDLLEAQFDQWRGEQAGRADATLSSVSGDSEVAVGAQCVLRVELEAYPGVPVTVPTTLRAQSSDPGVLEVVSVGPIAGGFEVVVRGVQPGTAGLELRASDAVGKPVILMPQPRITVAGRIADVNQDGVVDLGDIQFFIQLFVERDPRADLNQDGVVDLADIQFFVASFLS